MQTCNWTGISYMQWSKYAEINIKGMLNKKDERETKTQAFSIRNNKQPKSSLDHLLETCVCTPSHLLKRYTL